MRLFRNLAGTAVAIGMCVATLGAIPAYADGDAPFITEEECNSNLQQYQFPGYYWPDFTNMDTPIDQSGAVASLDNKAVYTIGTPHFTHDDLMVTELDPATHKVVRTAPLSDVNHNGTGRMTISPDGTKLYIFASNYATNATDFLVWDIATWALEGSVQLMNKTAGFPSPLSVTPEGKVIVYGDNLGFLVDPSGASPTYEAITPTYTDPTDFNVREGMLSPDGTTYAALDVNKKLVVFLDASTWEQKGAAVAIPASGYVNHMRWASDNTLLVSSKANIYLLDPNSSEVVGTLENAQNSSYQEMVQLDETHWIVTLFWSAYPVGIETFTLDEANHTGKLSGWQRTLSGTTGNPGPITNGTVVALEDQLFIGGSGTSDHMQVAWMPLLNVEQPVTVSVPSGGDEATFSTCVTSLVGFGGDWPEAYKFEWQISKDGGQTWEDAEGGTDLTVKGYATLTLPVPEAVGYLVRVNWSSEIWISKAEFGSDYEYAGIDYKGQEVEPQEPTLVPASTCGVKATVEIPEVEGVKYSQSTDGDIITVTATPEDGYVFPEGGTAVWKFNVAAEPCPPIGKPPFVTVADRISGPTRYGTNLELLKKTFQAGQVLFIARGSEYPDALAAAPAVVEQNGALALTPTSSLRPELVTFLQQNKPSKIYIVGGTGAVSNRALNQAAAIAPTERVSGVDRYATAQAVFNKFFATHNSGQVFVATGQGFPDALSASAAAGSVGAPVLLVKKNSIAGLGSIAALKDAGINSIHIVGGKGVVDLQVQSTLAKKGFTVNRLGGLNRYITNQVVNEYLGLNDTEGLWFATGADFPDALSAAVPAGAYGQRLVLSRYNCIPGPVVPNWIGGENSKVTSATLVGGTGVLSTNVQHLNACR